MKTLFSTARSMGLLLLAALLAAFPRPAVSAETPMSTTNAYSFSFTGIDGKPMPLEQFRGKVLLIVNTASQCGFTPQYADLEKLYETYKDKGLVVIGVPSDDFGGQEPGTETQIKQFTESKFHITFPLAAKANVVGDKRHPFYAWAAAQNKGGVLGTVPRWNFHKYLVGRDGQLVDSFVSPTKPMSSAVTSEIETVLGQ